MGGQQCIAFPPTDRACNASVFVKEHLWPSPSWFSSPTTEPPVIFHETQHDEWHLFSATAGQLCLLSHAGPPLHSPQFNSCTAQFVLVCKDSSALFPSVSQQHPPHRITNSLALFSPVRRSALKKRLRMRAPGPLRNCGLPFCHDPLWGSYRRFQLLYSSDQSQSPAPTIQPVHVHSIWTCTQEALRGSFPFTGASYHACP